MNAEDLPLEEIERLNLAMMKRGASDLEALEAGLTIPEEDLTLFFSQIPGPKMLDVGCGWGRYAERFPEAGMEYTGVDLSPDYLEIARRAHPNLDLREMSFHNLDFPDNTFDGVWGCCVLGGEPKRRVPEVLTELWRVLKPGGILLLVLPSAGWSEEGMVPEDEARFGAFYLSLWTPEEFSDMAKDAGFPSPEVIHRYDCGSATFLFTK